MRNYKSKTFILIFMWWYESYFVTGEYQYHVSRPVPDAWAAPVPAPPIRAQYPRH